jgi:nucleoside-diphosphate-sugar epimerase
VDWRKADLTNPGEIAALMEGVRPSHLLALAWPMGPDTRYSAENYRWLQHSLELLFAFAQAGGKRAVFGSSCAEYDWTGDEKLHETRSLLRPACDYGAAKSALFAAYGPMAARLGFSAAWARIFFLYGPRENRTRLAGDVIASLFEGREVPCSEGMQQRDFMHVGDAGRALAMLLDSDVTGPVNIGSGRAIPVAGLIREAARQIGRPELIRFGARPSRADDAPIVEADNTRLRSEVGFAPHFNLETGLADTIDWWRTELKREQA